MWIYFVEILILLDNILLHFAVSKMIQYWGLAANSSCHYF